MIHIADPDIGDAEWDAVESVLASGQLAAGEQVAAFESEFAAVCETEDAVATSNGTTALHTALEALELPEGAKVITTPFTFVATANAVRHAGLEPVFVDVDPDTFNMDPDDVETVLEAEDDAVGAILAVHLYGLPADMPRLREIAAAHDVALVEDAAQAHGATIDGQPVGSFGDVAAFSFYPTKNITTGEGGMVVTDDPEIATVAREFINHGRTESGGTYDHARVGHNFRLTDIAAAIGRVQLRKLEEFTAERRRNAKRYNALLADTEVDTPMEPADRRHVYHQYTIKTADRDALQSHLEEHDVGSAVYYPRPIHQQPPYADAAGTLPVAEELADTVLSVPVHPNIDGGDIEEVVSALTAFEEVKA